MKYLIAGLGNIGAEYTETRHNIGFKVVDALAKAAGVAFETGRYGSVAELKYKGRTFILLKPSTYMNLSGKAVGYWLKTEKIPIENLFVVVDDIALRAQQLRPAAFRDRRRLSERVSGGLRPRHLDKRGGRRPARTARYGRRGHPVVRNGRTRTNDERIQQQIRQNDGRRFLGKS